MQLHAVREEYNDCRGKEDWGMKTGREKEGIARV